MKYRSVLAFLVLCTAAQAGEVEDTESIVITKKRANECQAGGGCAYVTSDELRSLAEKMFEGGQRYANATCASRIGLR